LDTGFEDIRQQFLNVRAHRGRTAALADVVVKRERERGLFVHRSQTGSDLRCNFQS